VYHVEAQLELLDRFLAHAVHDKPARALIAGKLSAHTRNVVDDLLHVYSAELAVAEISLITAIMAYELDGTEQSLDALRERLREFHVAVSAARADLIVAVAA
jgi:hypothetical protein